MKTKKYYKKRKKEKKRENNNTKKKRENNKDKMFHFYDDNENFLTGIKFSNDGETIENIMCTNNIICHKLTPTYNNNVNEKVSIKFLKSYLKKIKSNPIKNFISYRQEQLTSNNGENNVFFDPNCGLNNKDFHFLKDPNLKNIIVGFDMDSTLHQTEYFLNIPLHILIKKLSILTKSKITINDIGEYYFGGIVRLNKIKEVFQNLNKTIGMQNVYVITANPSSLLKEIIPKLYSKLFNVKFTKENVKVAIKNQLTKYNIILDIMKN